MNTMEPYPFLRENLKTLESQGDPVVSWLAGQGVKREDLDGRIFLNRRGMVDWRMSGGDGLFDAITPERAYKGWTPEDQADSSASLVIGSNLGYGLHHLLSRTPEEHQVMVLEPKPEMLLACLGYRDYRPDLKKKRLHFIPPDREILYLNISRFTLPCLFGKIFLRSDLPSRQLGPEYAIWAEQAKEALEYLRVELNTVRNSQDRMISNELGNFQRAMGEGSLTDLRGKGRGLSAVILGAGPSLEVFAPLLAENQGQALYGTGLQTLPVLRKHGLKPHFCMNIDSNKQFMGVYDHLDRAWAADIPLVYSTTVHPEVVKAYPGPTVPLWTLGGLASFIPQGRELVLDVGNNVGVALTRLMSWFGVDRILLTGQDFSWPEAKTHAEGHFMSGRGSFQFDPGSHIRLENRDGETIYTAQPYVTALKMLERDIARLTIPVFNLYGGGMMIEGCRTVTWDKVLAEGLLKSDPEGPGSFLKRLKEAPPAKPWLPEEALSPQWINALRSARNKMEKLFKKPDRNKGEIRSTLDHILALIQQDPLFRPYLFNEILNLAGLMFTKRCYGIKDLLKSRQIVKRAFAKVLEIERGLRPLSLES